MLTNRKRYLSFAVVVAVVSGVLGLPSLASSATAVRGIDVSSYQHPSGAGINWNRVARAGYRFAFIKDTEGTYYVNPWFASDSRAAQAAGMKVGAYHFANPSQSSGWAQARYMLSHSAYRRGMLRPVLDIERNPYQGGYCYGLSPTRMVSWIGSFERTIHRRTGVWAIINTPAVWWNRCTNRSLAFGNRSLWVENSTHDATHPVLPAGWQTWAYWQYSITSHVPGIAAITDLDMRNPAF